jgi:hypothetical protein
VNTAFVKESLFAEEIQTSCAHVSVISEVTGIVVVILVLYYIVYYLKDAINSKRKYFYWVYFVAAAINYQLSTSRFLDTDTCRFFFVRKTQFVCNL